MAGMCFGVVGETKTPTTVEHKNGRQRRRMDMDMDIRQLKFLAAAASDVIMPLPESTRKRRKVDTVQNSGNDTPKLCDENSVDTKRDEFVGTSSEISQEDVSDKENSRFGLTVVCGRRRDLEDAVAVKPAFVNRDRDDLHFYGVYDGHGCSHVAMKCKDRMHEIVKEEVEKNEDQEMKWKETMVKSFSRMDKDVTEWSSLASSSNCRCELQTPQCDAVGSTAVVAVPDRPDELQRIEEAGGRVIYWDGARVLGVLAMSRAIGDNYLKPYVIPEPEVTVTERTAEDECLILASDGLWDVVSNDVACSVARMCLRSQEVPSPPRSPGSELNVARGESSDKACSDASTLLTKLALARRSTDNVSVVVVDLRRNI
ncbi:phosphatase 2C 37-like protein [Tanacetum coccineum]